MHEANREKIATSPTSEPLLRANHKSWRSAGARPKLMTSARVSKCCPRSLVAQSRRQTLTESVASKSNQRAIRPSRKSQSPATTRSRTAPNHNPEMARSIEDHPATKPVTVIAFGKWWTEETSVICLFFSCEKCILKKHRLIRALKHDRVERKGGNRQISFCETDESS